MQASGDKAAPHWRGLDCPRPDEIISFCRRTTVLPSRRPSRSVRPSAWMTLMSKMSFCHRRWLVARSIRSALANSFVVCGHSASVPVLSAHKTTALICQSSASGFQMATREQSFMYFQNVVFLVCSLYRLNVLHVLHHLCDVYHSSLWPTLIVN